MNRDMRRETEQRTMVIQEVNMNTGIILARDNFGTLTSLSIHANPAITTIPAIGEEWIVSRKGINWFIDKRVDEDTSDLSPGDRRIKTSGNIHLEGNDILVNGESLDSKISSAVDAIIIPDIDIDPAEFEIDYTQIVIEEGEIEPAFITPGNNTDVLATRDDVAIWRRNGYGTSLPSAPLDGDEFTLVDSLTSPNYIWRFRFTASITDAYKWVYVGGTPYKSESSAAVTHTGITYSNGSTPLAALTIPQAGLYLIELGIAQSGANGNPGLLASVSINGTTSSDNDATARLDNFGNTTGSGYGRKQHTISATHTLQAQYRLNSDAGGWSITTVWRSISVTPLRVATPT